jgi:hypothetical protein
VARRLRRAGLRGRTVTLRVKLATRRRDAGDAPHRLFPLRTRGQRLDHATSDGRAIATVAVRLWDAAGITEPVRLLGVSVSGLERAGAGQLSLFGADAASERGERLGRVLDAIQDRYGARAIDPRSPRRRSSPLRTGTRAAASAARAPALLRSSQRGPPPERAARTAAPRSSAGTLD